MVPGLPLGTPPIVTALIPSHTNHCQCNSVPPECTAGVYLFFRIGSLLFHIQSDLSCPSDLRVIAVHPHTRLHRLSQRKQSQPQVHPAKHQCIERLTCGVDVYVGLRPVGGTTIGQQLHHFCPSLLKHHFCPTAYILLTNDMKPTNSKRMHGFAYLTR